MPYNPGNWGVYSQGLQALSGGIASAGDAIADGIKEYARKKEENELLTARIEGLVPQMQSTAAQGALMDPDSEESAMLKKLSGASAASLSQKKAILADSLLWMDRKERQRDKALVEARQQEQARNEARRLALAELAAQQGTQIFNLNLQEKQAALRDDAAMGAALGEFSRTNERGVGDLPLGIGQSEMMQGLAGAAGPTRELGYPERMNRSLQAYSAAGGGGPRGHQLLQDLARYQPKPATGLPIGQSVPVYGQPTPPLRDAPLLGYTIGTGDGVTFRPSPESSVDGAHEWLEDPETGARFFTKGRQVLPSGTNPNTPAPEVPEGFVAVRTERGGWRVQPKPSAGQVTDKLRYAELMKDRRALEKAYSDPLTEDKAAVLRKLQANQVEVDKLQSAAPAAPTAKTAQGGYKIGTRYNGLKYLGGDPNQEQNWER